MSLELRRLHAQEEAAVTTLKEMEAQAFGELARTTLQEAIDAAPSRLGRLEIVLDGVEEPESGKPLWAFVGWRKDAQELGMGASPGEAHDAALLSLVLRMMRTRTACYEATHILARSMHAVRVANLLGTLLSMDRAMDDRVAETLARVVAKGDGRWDLKELQAWPPPG